MSKFPNIFAPAAAGAGVMFVLAYTLADGFIVPVPDTDSLFQVAAPQPAPVAIAEAPAQAPSGDAIATGTASGGLFALGRAALPEEIAAWDRDILPDGTGLPVGSGDVYTGEEVFGEVCAACHGDFAEGIDNWPELAGGWDSLADEDPVKTVGSYWPYLSTTFDYVRRSMPFGGAQTLTDDETYAIVAYILYSNNLVEDDFVLSNETFFDVSMPNAEGFIVDDRPTAEAHFWTDAPCMSDCKDSVDITMRATVLDVTPEDEGIEAPAQAASGDATATATASGGLFALGRAALPEEIAAWDRDILPDGTGLPVGYGDVYTGEEVFGEVCAACHGDFAEGIDNWPELAGGWGSLADEDPVKTVGSYWPYLSTTFDYVRRSMPFGGAQTLTDDETYAIVAYILYSNNLVEDDFVLSNETFFDVSMPNAEGFIVDDRAAAEAHFWTDDPCMSDCKDSVDITMRATVLDVTPEDEATDPEPVALAALESDSAEAGATGAGATLDPALVAAGKKTFGKCKSCHQIGAGAKNRSGPQLNNVIGRQIGGVEGFKYSAAMAQAGEGGVVWTDESMSAFLEKPKAYIKGTKMSFAGLKDPADRTALVAYLKSMEE